jgi:cardiolipin synthase
VSTPLLTVANQLTILRMALTPLLVVLVLSRDLGLALAVFVMAGVTDLLDGVFARRGGRTKLGAMLDPVADKLLLCSSFVVLTWGGGLATRIPPWLTVTTLSRDAIIVVSVVVVNLTIGRRVFYPSVLGKLATTCQLLTVGVVLLLNALGVEQPAVVYLFKATLLLTVASALHYVYLASAHPGQEF